MVPAQPSPAVWSVDADGARMFFADLLSKLHNPAEARRVNAYLRSMKVKGSLLAPAVNLLNDGGEVQVQRTHWTESAKPGMLRLDAMLLATAQGQAIKLRVTAEFHGTAEGTVLAVLDLKEGD